MKNIDNKTTVLVNIKDIKIAQKNISPVEDTSRVLWALVLLTVPLIIFGAKLLFWLVSDLPKFFLGMLVYLIYATRVILVVLLDEKARLKNYKKNKLKKYQDVQDLSDVASIKDGLVTMKNGSYKMFIVARNGGKVDSIANSSYLSELFTLLKDYHYNMYFLNIPDILQLDERYQKLSVLSSPKDRKRFMNCIKHSKTLIEDKASSIVTIIEVKWSSKNYYDVVNKLETAISLVKGKVYKDVYLADTADVEYILNRTLYTSINYNSVMEDNLNTSAEFYGSKIIGTNVEEKEYTTNKTKSDNIGFLPSK